MARGDPERREEVVRVVGLMKEALTARLKKPLGPGVETWFELAVSAERKERT
jgi:hypothetical protein